MDKKEVEPRQAGRSQVPPNSDPRYKFIPKTGQAGKERDRETIFSFLLVYIIFRGILL